MARDHSVFVTTLVKNDGIKFELETTILSFLIKTLTYVI